MLASVAWTASVEMLASVKLANVEHPQETIILSNSIAIYY